MAGRAENFNSDGVVESARVTLFQRQNTIQRSTSTMPAATVFKRLAETQRRIAESKDRITRTDRLLRVLQEEIVFKPVTHKSASPIRAMTRSLFVVKLLSIDLGGWIVLFQAVIRHRALSGLSFLPM